MSEEKRRTHPHSKTDNNVSQVLIEEEEDFNPRNLTAINISRDDSEMFGEEYFLRSQTGEDEEPRQQGMVLSPNNWNPPDMDDSSSFVRETPGDTDDGLFGEDIFQRRGSEMTTEQPGAGPVPAAGSWMLSPSPRSPIVMADSLSSGDATTPPPVTTAASQASLSPPPLRHHGDNPADYVSDDGLPQNGLSPKETALLHASNPLSHPLLPVKLAQHGTNQQHRPPRPIVAPRMRTSSAGSAGATSLPAQIHNRGHSHGDGSLMSALTDYDSSYYDEPHHHHRDVRGMNIDIPSGLQQPILFEEEDRGSEAVAKEAGAAVPAARSGISSVVNEETVEMKPPPPAAVGPTSPPPIVRNNSHEVSESHERPIHQRISSQLCEFENEAETKLLQAIEEELNASDAMDIREELFPLLTDEAAELEEVMDREQATNASSAGTHSSRSGSTKEELSDAMRKWLALQATVDPNSNSVLYVQPEKEGDETGPTSLLVNNAAIYMSNTQKNRPASVERKTSDGSRGSSPLRAGAHTSSGDEDGAVASGPSSTDENDTTVLDDTEAGRRYTYPVLREMGDSAIRLPSQFREGFVRNWKQLKTDWELFEEFLEPQKESLKGYLKGVLYYFIFPSLIIATILYYGVDNPYTGYAEPASAPAPVPAPSFYSNEKKENDKKASISWWFIFIGVRQVLTFSLAKGTEFILIHYLGVSSRRFIRLVGPRLGMLISHSSGWPCVLFFVGVYDLAFLYGEHDFAKHWLFWQHTFDMFSKKNPAGDVTGRELYERFLLLFLTVGVAVTIKRLLMGYHLGRRMYSCYNKRVSEVMDKMLLLSEVAAFSISVGPSPKVVGLSGVLRSSTSPGAKSPSPRADSLSDDIPTTPQRLENTISIGLSSRRPEIMAMLEDWEEPTQSKEVELKNVSLKEIIEFRQAFLLVQTDYPFSNLFGLANTRTNCVESSTRVYRRLLKKQQSNDGVLRFDSLGEIATNNDGTLDRSKLKELIRLLRPDRKGMLTLLDFVKSTDAVYREIRTLAAGIRNATAIDRAYEKLFTIAFYCILALVGLAILGVDTMAFIISLSSIVVAFAFAIGSASSSWFEGVLLILARRPYDIGDRIAVQDVEEEPSVNGSNGWIVENIGLFTTTIRYSKTREVATIANGSLARSRIINMQRSDQAQVMIFLKFGTNVPYQKIMLFRRAVEKFVHDRPREWLKPVGFRSTRVESDLGFIEYVVVLQSRDSWQKTVPILESKARVSSFCLELQKLLDMRYSSPPMPVNLNFPAETAEEERRRSESLIRETSQVRFRQSTDGKASGGDKPGHKGVKSAESLDEGILALAKLFETKKSR